MDDPTSYGLQAPVPGARAESGPAVEQRLVGGRYRLLRRLGHGGMGTVWVAHDERVEREVAVKEPRLPDTLPTAQRENVHERMRREARSAARISHPAVVSVHDVVVEDERPWIVMELVRGESLADVLDAGTVDGREAARVGLEVLAALSAAHEAGVLHRDVKPANVLLGRDGRVVLTDFGIAQVEGEQGLTETGAFVGSPEFIAPERVLGQRPGPASDLWSLGVLLYVAVEGVSPFRRNNTPATMQAVLSAQPQTPARAAGPLGSLIMRLLAKDPAERPDAEAVQRELEAFLRPPPTVPVTRIQAAGVVAPALAGAGGGRRLLPTTAKGRIAVGAGAAVVASALVLLLLNPFGSSTPGGWEVKQEEDLGVTWAIPEDFEETEPEEDPDSANWAGYDSPDGLYSIRVWHRNPEERDANTAAADQRSSIQGSLSYTEAEGRFYERDFEELDAAEMTLLTRDAEDTPRRQSLHLFVSADGPDQLWHVRVLMPGEDGAAKEYGEELYEELLDELSLQAQEQKESEENENDL